MVSIAEEAKKLIGVPFKYGAKPEEAPNFFDCSSLTQYRPPVYIGHVAFYIGDEKIIQATGSAGKVIEENLKEFINQLNCSVVMVKRILL